MSLVGTVGAELNSVRSRNDRYLKEQDAARAVVEKIRSDLEVKYQANLLSARASAVEEHKASEEYRSM